MEYFASKATINGDLCYKFVQEIFYKYSEKVEDRYLGVGKKQRVFRYSLHTDSLRYILNFHTINISMKVFGR